jgi:hypothetical protein
MDGHTRRTLRENGYRQAEDRRELLQFLDLDAAGAGFAALEAPHRHAGSPRQFAKGEPPDLACGPQAQADLAGNFLLCVFHNAPSEKGRGVGVVPRGWNVGTDAQRISGKPVLYMG